MINEDFSQFLDEVESKDKTLSVYIELYRFSILVIQCWESQRIADYQLYISSIKETLPYLFAFNRYNYQHSTLEFLSDISLLGDFYTDLLNSGIMFESMASQPGKHTSCGYVLEIYNKIIKQITPNIDGSGSGWLRNLPRLAFIRQILQNASNANLFSETEKDPLKSKIPNMEQIAKLRWVLENRNLLGIDNAQYFITEREAIHVITGQIIEKRFLECKQIGLKNMKVFVRKIIECKPLGSFEWIRKEMKLKKIVPFLSKRKVTTKTKSPLTKAEKQILLSNLQDDEIPMTSFSMLSPNGVSPYLGSKKSDSGKFILNRYACEISIENEEFDLIVLDFMALVFCKPPSHVYASKLPLEAFCTWLVSTMLTPSLSRSSSVVVCIDRKALDEDFPLKCETHKNRESKSSGKRDFTHLLGKLLDTDLEIVTKFYIPPYSWMSRDRKIRFQLIFKAFQEIFENPMKYPFPDTDFKLYVDGFKNDGYDLRTAILTYIGGSYSTACSEFSVFLPEADQSIFYIIKKLPYDKCLIKYRDNDILMASIFQCQEICNRPNQKIILQNIDSNKTCYDVNQICESISNDETLSELKLPVQSLILSFLIIGNNDYSGKVWGLSCDLAFRSLQKMKGDLACVVNNESLASSSILPEHLFTIFSSKCKYSLSYPFFQKFVKLLYIEKNASLFKGMVQLPLPKNIRTWKKVDLITAFSILDIPTVGENDKDLLVPELKVKITSHLNVNPSEKSKLDSFISDGISPLDIEYACVQKTIWLNKNPRDWCPSLLQIKNMYGRCVLTGLLFSCPEYFPPKIDLTKFGYILQNGNISFDLSPSLTKEKSQRTVYASVLKLLGQTSEIRENRKRNNNPNLQKAKRQKQVGSKTLMIE